MASLNTLLAAGFSPLQAQMIATGPINTITPAGASQGTATLVNSPSVVLGTAGAAGVILPPASGAPETTVFNNSGAGQSVYPALGDSINSLSPNTAVTITNNKCGNFIPGDRGWLFTLSA